MSFAYILLTCNILLYFFFFAGAYSLISEVNKTFRINTFRTLNSGRWPEGRVKRTENKKTATKRGDSSVFINE